jgi:hypothetical protein
VAIIGGIIARQTGRPAGQMRLRHVQALGELA